MSKRGAPPFFSGVNLSAELKAPLITVSDPSLNFSEDLLLAWYAGNNLEKKLPEKISCLLECIFNQLNLKPIMLGGSGGGYASLLQTFLSKRTVKTVVWNPQTAISQYNLNAVINYLSICFPEMGKDIQDGLHCSKEEKSAKLNSLFFNIGIVNSLLNYELKADKEILYLQNFSDRLHCMNHFTPFFKNIINKKRLALNVFSTCNTYFYVGDWGYGHVVPPKEMLLNIIREIIEGNSCLEDISFKLSLSHTDESFVPLLELEEDYSDLTAKICYHRGERKLIIYSKNLRNKNYEYAVYFMNGSERAHTSWYQISNIFDLPDCYFDSVKIFLKDFVGDKFQKKFKIKVSVR